MASGRGVAFAERGEEGRPWTELPVPLRSDTQPMLFESSTGLFMEEFTPRRRLKGWPRRRKVVIGAGAVFDAR